MLASWPPLSNFGLDYGPCPAHLNHASNFCPGSSSVNPVFGQVLAGAGRIVLQPSCSDLQNRTVWDLLHVRNRSWPFGWGSIPWELEAWALLKSICFCLVSSSVESSKAIAPPNCCRSAPAATMAPPFLWQEYGLTPVPPRLSGWTMKRHDEETWWKDLLVGKLGSQQNLLNLPPLLHNSILAFQGCFNSSNHIVWQHDHSFQNLSCIWASWSNMHTCDNMAKRASTENINTRYIYR